MRKCFSVIFQSACHFCCCGNTKHQRKKKYKERIRKYFFDFNVIYFRRMICFVSLRKILRYMAPKVLFPHIIFLTTKLVIQRTIYSSKKENNLPMTRKDNHKKPEFPLLIKK